MKYSPESAQTKKSHNVVKKTGAAVLAAAGILGVGASNANALPIAEIQENPSVLYSAFYDAFYVSTASTTSKKVASQNFENAVVESSVRTDIDGDKVMISIEHESGMSSEDSPGIITAEAFDATTGKFKEGIYLVSDGDPDDVTAVAVMATKKGNITITYTERSAVNMPSDQLKQFANISYRLLNGVQADNK